jgi:hypothetical protein
MRLFLFGLISLLLFSCGQETTRFTRLSPAATGIDYTNTITETKEHNVFTYQYYYNGNGVAVGDVDGDGLADLFFTGNQTPSKLYLNKGGLKFDDITAQAGVAGKNAWRTGASMVDINADGLLDIYVCYSGFGTEEERANQLFINQGKDKSGHPVFVEKAAEYGIDAPGTYTSQSVFFDYDKDGDLDMFLLNHANEFYSPFFNTTHLRNLRHPQYGNRLYRNDEGKFTDVSTAAGIYGSGLNFGLGVSVSDLNNDGWPDIFVSNDFHEQDFVYLNKGDGSFREAAQEVFAHMSRNTMGTDIADYNNDLLPDVAAMDMLPESHYRQKILQGADEYDKYNLMVDSGYGHQNNRNVLQLNRGLSADSLPVFSEVGQLAGVSNTDWSWAALFADFDNDGWKDLFVTNGYLRESTNLDFMKYEVAAAYQQAQEMGLDLSTPETYARNMPLYDLVNKMPSTKISNYLFRNKGDLTFANETAGWGLADEGVSSGAAYADLDNDGDLDLVVCNNNDPVWLYQNNTNETAKQNFIRVTLKGNRKNSFALGAKVIVSTAGGSQVQEMYPVRGYQSSVDYVLHFGLGNATAVTELKVVWPSDSVSVLQAPAINTLLTIDQATQQAPVETPASPFLFKDISAEAGIDFLHTENLFVDFKREYLIPYELSKQGPKMSKADVNGDGLEDLFIGGAAEQSGVLYLQTGEGKFKKSPSQPWQEDAIYEDVGSLFFDADSDGDADLYVVSGGSEWAAGAAGLQDRLYINRGSGVFAKPTGALPQDAFSGSCVTAADFDKDGDLDLFIGARVQPGQYPLSTGNRVLRNDKAANGAVRFTDVTLSLGGETLFNAGMVTDALWTDIDKDGWPDLVVAGDWMPVTVFRNEGGKVFANITAQLGLDKSNGWWCKIVPADIDGDGDIDIIAGNMGTNTQFKARPEEPLVTYAGDFNGDGRLDPVMTWYIQGKSYPFNSRDELMEQMPGFNKRFLRYADYAKAATGDVLTAEQQASAKAFSIYTTQTSLLVNNNGKYEVKPLPQEAQFSAVSGILYKDFDGDGKADLLLSGNFYPFRVQQGRCDASIGSLLKGNGKGDFVPVDRNRSGLLIPGDVRDMVLLKGKEKEVVVISKNSGRVQVISGP